MYIQVETRIIEVIEVAIFGESQNGQPRIQYRTKEGKLIAEVDFNKEEDSGRYHQVENKNNN